MSTPQLPLSLRFPPDQRLAAFHDPDARALPLVAAVADGAAADWLYLDGAAGSGKTHLLLAACAQADARGRRAVYLPLATLGAHAAEALAGNEAADLVAIDGLDAICGDRGAEVALFDFHNAARAAGAAVLYAARGAPAALPLELPDLRSRLAQCTRIALQPLDDAGRRAVLRMRGAARGLQLDDAVIDWLLVHVERDLASLGAVLDRLDRASLAARRRPTVPFLRQLLRE
ncbi:DnaA regulatory inactivator Hda [Coralloluteibacterium stylophorae]|uniref:DnaA regulatory inactivator Hda n=1 Tax=Coralloluteibacterium stylophorae TaxID=1776034 RepID=A0AAP2CBX6_9GAMM|nr:DnaA regulatory inactivator Hda [Coralloluteibacterium stylophorae]MBS7456727.1 DnaA regulatory inactivator Hda [Coralloluteibacterium stylophorae]